MASGRFKHKIKIVEHTNVKDSFGSNKQSVNVVATVKANVQVISGTERVNAGVAIDSEFISVLTRYDTRISYDKFIVWNGREYIIRTKRPDDRNRQLVLTCSADIQND